MKVCELACCAGALVLAFVACARDDDGGGGALARDGPSTVSPEAPAYTATLERLRVVRTLGELDGPDGSAFGLIADVRADASGTTYVLDSRLQRIAVYDHDGQLLGTSGRPGRGPGEFREPGGLAFRADTLVALDVGNMRLHLYDSTADALTFSRAIQLPFMARSVCSIGSRVFLSGMYDGMSVHELGHDGAVLNSFGEAYAALEVPPGQFRRTLRANMSEGVLACATEPESIVLVPRNRPEVTAFSADGSVLWRTVLADYSQMTARMTSPGTMQYAGDPRTGGQHTAQGALILPPRLLVVQLAFLSGAGYRSRDEAPSDTRVLDLGTGEEVARLEGIAGLTQTGAGTALGFTNVPFPKVLYFEMD